MLEHHACQYGSAMSGLDTGTSCPKFVPGSPRPRCAGEGHVAPVPMGHLALGPSSTLGVTRRGLRVSPTGARAEAMCVRRLTTLPPGAPGGRMCGELLAAHPRCGSRAIRGA